MKRRDSRAKSGIFFFPLPWNDSQQQLQNLELNLGGVWEDRKEIKKSCLVCNTTIPKVLWLMRRVGPLPSYQEGWLKASGTRVSWGNGKSLFSWKAKVAWQLIRCYIIFSRNCNALLIVFPLGSVRGVSLLFLTCGFIFQPTGSKLGSWVDLVSCCGQRIPCGAEQVLCNNCTADLELWCVLF